MVDPPWVLLPVTLYMVARAVRGAVPVHAVVVPEAVVLDGHQRVHQVLGQIAVLDELPVAPGLPAVVEEGEDGGAVLVVDGGRQGQGHLLGGDVPQGGDEGGVDVGHKDFKEDGRRQHPDDAQGEQGEKDTADEAGGMDRAAITEALDACLEK